MAGQRAALAILAALAVALVLAGSGGGEPGDEPAFGGAAASRPPAKRASDEHAAVLRIARVRPLVEAERLSTSVEPSCPPPGILACKPALRVTARLGEEPAAAARRRFETALVDALRTVGFRRMTLAPAARGFAGRVTARGEVLARWRFEDGAFEFATTGLPAGRRARRVDRPIAD